MGWSPQLVRAIAERNFVCVVGSGLSSASKASDGSHPPGWRSLLEQLLDLLSPSTTERRKLASLLSRDAYLDAAEYLKWLAREKGHAVDVENRLAQLVDGNPRDEFAPNAWHETLMRLDPPVLVTTNYDRIVERASGSGYSVHDPRSTTLDIDLRAGRPVLIKIHGTVDRKDEMVLCQTDYSKLRREAGHVFRIFEALVHTRCCLFVGYSFQDPDIRLVLENVMGGRGLAPSHYLLTPKLADKFRREALMNAYGVVPVEYAKTGGSHAQGLVLFQALADEVESARTLV